MADNFQTHCRTNPTSNAMEFYDKTTQTVQFGGSATNALTALSGGGQTGATPVSAVINRFTTVAGSGDSAILPLSAPGAQLTVINAGAQPLNVFPQTGEAINALSANTAFSVSNGKTCGFYCAVTGTWSTNLSA
jgi:hypothetical protein